MSKNTKNKNYKRFLQLRRREDELEAQIKNLGYRELEKPIHHGYNAYLTLREDVARRDDKVSELFQYFIDNYGTEPWSRTPEFYTKNKKGKITDNRARLRELSQKEYDTYLPWVQDYLREKITLGWGGAEHISYVIEVPTYYLVMKVKNSYITHVKIVDGELERELAFVEDEKWRLARDNGFYDYNHSPKWFRQTLNRADRRYNKMALKKNLNTNMPFDDSVEYLNEMLEIYRLENEYYGNEIHESHFKPLSKKEYYEDSDWTDWASSSDWNDDPKPFRYQHRHNAGWLWW